MGVASTARRASKAFVQADFPSVKRPASVSTDAGSAWSVLPQIARCKLRSAVRVGIRARICALVAPLQPCGTNRCSVDAVEAASHCCTPSQEQRQRSAATTRRSDDINAPQPRHNTLQLEDTDRAAHSDSRKTGRLPRARDGPATQTTVPEALALGPRRRFIRCVAAPCAAPRRRAARNYGLRD